jgi:acyl-CoA synthetase (AMP-forming)/AMP-acid ligase II
VDDSTGSRNYVLDALDLFAKFADTEAIIAGETRLSYADLSQATLHLATAIRAGGIEPGSPVAVLVPDRPDTLPMQLALHLLGCRTVWIATYAPPRDQAEFFRLAGARTLIYSSTPRRERLVAELAGGPEPVRFYSLGRSDRGTDLLAQTPRPRTADSLAAPAPESLFYTGGTTGRPKLVHHTQAFYQALLQIAAYYLSVGEPPMRFLYGSSFTHVSGQMPAFLTLFEGGTLVMTGDDDPADFLGCIEAERITSTFLTPAQLYQVIDHPRMKTADTSSLRYLNVGGAAAAPARLREAIGALGPVIRLVYGSSEVPLITDYPFLDVDPEHPERLASCGRPFAGATVEIRGPDGAFLPSGDTGEVWVRSPLTMAGYWGEPALTGDTMPGGWVRTGDVGRLDPAGYLYLVDRVSDMIVTGEVAANVYARPIEDVLTSHPAVRAAAVVGVPDESFGEALRAYVMLADSGGAVDSGGAAGSEGSEVTAAELTALVRAELNELYTPRGIEFIDALPLTPLGKVDKKALRERYRLRRPDSPAAQPSAGTRGA